MGVKAPEVEEAPDELEDAAAQDSIGHQSLAFSTKKYVLQAMLEKAFSVLGRIKDKVFLVEAKDGVRVTGTDLEHTVISTSSEVSIDREGYAVLPGRLLEVVKEAPDGDITVDVKDGIAQVRAGRAKWDLKLTSPDYPAVPDGAEVTLYPIDRARFVQAVGSVRYAAAREAVRPGMMVIDVSKGRMRATDGIRFQQVDLGEDFVPIDFHVPIEGVEFLLRLLKSTEMQEAEVGTTEDYVVFRIGEDRFITAKKVAQFPDVDTMLLKPAQANDQELFVDRQELIQAIRRVRVTADPDTAALAVGITPGTVRVSSKDRYGNRAEEEIDAGWSTGDREVACNHVHLLEMLQMAQSSSLKFALGKDTKTRRSPLLLKDDAAGMLGVLPQIRADYI